MAFGWSWEDTRRVYSVLAVLGAIGLMYIFLFDPWYNREFCTINAPAIAALQNKGLCLVECTDVFQHYTGMGQNYTFMNNATPFTINETAPYSPVT